MMLSIKISLVYHRQRIQEAPLGGAELIGIWKQIKITQRKFMLVFSCIDEIHTKIYVFLK